MIKRQDILELVNNLKPHKRGHVESPHKALLLLYSLGRIQRGCERLQGYRDLELDIKKLFEMRGIRPRPHMPFKALRTDKLWEVPDNENLTVTANGSFLIRELKELDVVGGLPRDIHDELQNDPKLVAEVTLMLLHRFFPETHHEDLLQAVGLTSVVVENHPYIPSHRLWRDPKFREMVIDEYGARCAICEQDLTIGGLPFDIEAAHIRPVCDNGPHIIQNGLAMCSLHHRAFDRGVIGLREDKHLYRVMVSDQVEGTSRRALLDINNRAVAPPRRRKSSPDLKYVEYHQRHYFRSPPVMRS